MANKFPRQQLFFTSFNKPKDTKIISDILICMSAYLSECARSDFVSDYSALAKRNPYALEMNVLVIGMPNVGKSTLLNALRHIGMPGSKYAPLQSISLLPTDLLPFVFQR